jgi:putative ABC transport system permease protein
MDQVMIIKPTVLTRWDSTYINRTNHFKEELKQLAHVKGAATSWTVPGGEMGGANIRLAIQVLPQKYHAACRFDYDFFNVYQVKLLAGRKFDPSDHNLTLISYTTSSLINRQLNYLASLLCRPPLGGRSCDTITNGM